MIQSAGTSPSDSSSDTDEQIAFCLEQIGANSENWRTLVVAASAATSQPVPRLSAILEDLENWPAWSPLHSHIRWEGGNELVAGAQFQQTLKLGFPLGTATAEVTIAFSEPGSLVGWLGDDAGVKSCHVWRLAAARDGAVLVCNVEPSPEFPPL